jgi:hypothetical protein
MTKLVHEKCGGRLFTLYYRPGGRKDTRSYTAIEEAHRCENCGLVVEKKR